MLPLDVILMRLTLAALVGIVAAFWTSDHVAAFLSCLTLYLLLVLFRRPVNQWPYPGS